MRLPTKSALLAAAALVGAPLSPVLAKGKPPAAAKAPKAEKPAKAAKAEKPPKPAKPPKPLNKDQYAAAVIKAVQAAGVTEKATYDKKKFKVVVGANTIDLAKPFAAHVKMLQEDRDAQLAELAATVKPPPAPEAPKAPEPPPAPVRPETFEAAGPRLRPVVREKMFFDLAEAALKAKDPSASIPRKPVGDTLAAGVAIDGEEQALVTAGDLSKWSSNIDDALAASDKNVSSDASGLKQVEGTKAYTASWSDDYAPARVRLAELLKKAEVDGDPVVIAPNTRTIFIAGAKDNAGLEKIAQLASEAAGNGTPVSTMPLKVVDGKYTLFLPDSKANPQLFEKFKVLALKSLERDYASQAKLIGGKDAQVAPFGLIGGKASGKTFSVATWKAGSEALLPRTDYVQLVGADGTPLALASWDKVAKAVGASLKADASFSPKRYRASGFPSDEQIKALGNASADSL